MAIYRIFPESDSFIYTENIEGNAGRDEILEIGGYPVSAIGQTSRTLVKFSTADIQEVINTKIDASSFNATLHLSLASAYELPHSYTLYAYPVYDDWTNGVGKFGDIPVDKSGVSWIYRKGSGITDGVVSGLRWTTPLGTPTGSIPPGVTSSYNSTYEGGGGAWYTGSNGIDLESSQLFELTKDSDVHIDITNAVLLHYSGSINNNGYIVKLSDDLEFNTTSSIRLKYFSSDTNTIYPPYMEFSWDDSTFVTGSLSVLNSPQAVVQVTNNKGTYIPEGKQRYRLKARPKYPTRTFTTSSSYLTNYALPSDSYWGLRDEYTEEMVVPFNTGSTKISCDSVGSYFDIYMGGLQPERYYRILVKTTLDGSTTVIDNNNIFKVVRNG